MAIDPSTIASGCDGTQARPERPQHVTNYGGVQVDCEIRFRSRLPDSVANYIVKAVAATTDVKVRRYADVLRGAEVTDFVAPCSEGGYSPLGKMTIMTHDWVLVETLGSEPAVVAEGAHTKNLIPISTFLRRNPNLMAIQTAIGETVRAGKGLSSITPKNDRVICTEVVQMSDGRIHGVQIWVGTPDEEPPPRPVVGSLIWDLTRGTATDTRESLIVGGWDPDRESTHGRAFADDLPRRDLNPNEAEIMRMVIKPEEGVTICNTWDVTDYLGERITVGFVTRSLPEDRDDDKVRLICRAMNWRSLQEGPSIQEDLLGERILDSLAEPGAYRALVDPRHWSLLKWLDEPVPFFDWRAGIVGDRAHPHDQEALAAMAAEFATGATSGVLRMVAHHGGWTPVHVSVHRVELGKGVYAGLAAFRVPTREELAVAGFDEPAEPTRGARKPRSRKEKATKA